MNPMRSVLSVVLLAALLAGRTSAQQAPEPLRNAEDPSRVAVRMVSRDLEPDLADLGARLGVRFTRSDRFGPPEMRLLELDASLDARALRRLVASLVAESDIDYATTVRRGPAGLPRIPQPYVLIRFLPSVSEEAQRAALGVFPDLRIDRPRLGGMERAFGLASAATTGDEVLAQVALLRALPGVDWVQPDRVLTGRINATIPDDPLFGNCWGLDNTGQTVGGITGLPDFDMDAPEAWDLTTGSDAVLVVVLDDGVQQDHPDLNLGPGADFTGGTAGGGPVNICGDHGTSVAGTISAVFNNSLGTVGVAPRCRVASAGVFVPFVLPCTGSGSVTESALVDALTWALFIGARVTNMSFSLGGGDESDYPAFSAMLLQARENGIIHFASSGNDGDPFIGYPASDPSVVAVGAVQADGKWASFASTGCPSCGSSWGVGLELVAPGSQIQTTDRTGAAGYGMGDYTVANGTSYSSPYAAGVAALVISRHPSIQPHELELILQMSATDVGATGCDLVFGYGMVNAFKALTMADVDLSALQVGYGIVDPAFPMIPPLYNNVTAAVAGVPAGGMVILKGQSYAEKPVITKKLVLRRWDTTAVVGK